MDDTASKRRSKRERIHRAQRCVFCVCACGNEVVGLESSSFYVHSQRRPAQRMKNNLAPALAGSAPAAAQPANMLQHDCAGRSYADLERLFHEQGYFVFTPCTFQQHNGQLLDAIDQFTVHAARSVIRSNRGEGCQGSKEAANRKTCQFDVVGGERKPIQDGLMNQWTKNRATHDIATCREVRDLLTRVHDGKQASPFQTKNWYVGSMTPTHADLVFHDSWPQRGLLVGTWLALEDIAPTSGPLIYYPGTHNGTVWDFDGLNLTRAGAGTVVKNPYQAYASRLHEVVSRLGLKPVQALLKRGEMLVWRGNLLHGELAPLAPDPMISRLSCAVATVPRSQRVCCTPLFLVLPRRWSHSTRLEPDTQGTHDALLH